MSLSDAFIQEAARVNIWLANRTDGLCGSGTVQDPFNASTKRHPAVVISLSLTAHPSGREAEATVLSGENLFEEGDVVEISGVTGLGATVWNGTFGIYDVEATSFKYLLSRPTANPQGSPNAARLTFPFDELMRDIPPSIRIHLGPGVFQTRGFGTNAEGAIDARGFQVKSGWNIVGSSADVTTVQLLGADLIDYHYHVFGMPIEPTGNAAITPLMHFEVADLTLDCNADNQPGRPDPGYAAVACGAVRVVGSFCRVRKVKAINWGTKSLKQGCFVISIIDASGKPTGADDQPVITETIHSGIEDCVAIQPSKNNARETTVLHLGGLKNAQNHAQGFAQAPFIRRNFVECEFKQPLAMARCKLHRSGMDRPLCRHAGVGYILHSQSCRNCRRAYPLPWERARVRGALSPCAKQARFMGRGTGDLHCQGPPGRRLNQLQQKPCP